MDIANTGKLRAHAPGVAVVRVVNHDDFAGGAALSCNAQQALGQRVVPIARADHDRDVLRGRRRRRRELIQTVDEVFRTLRCDQRERRFRPAFIGCPERSAECSVASAQLRGQVLRCELPQLRVCERQFVRQGRPHPQRQVPPPEYRQSGSIAGVDVDVRRAEVDMSHSEAVHRHRFCSRIACTRARERSYSPASPQTPPHSSAMPNRKSRPRSRRPARAIALA